MIVVIPFCGKDAIACAKNLEWMYELDGKTAYRCLLAHPDGVEAGRIKELAERVFADVHVFTYPDTEDHHWPAGANWSWQSVARYVPMITNSKGNSSPFDKIYPADESWLWLEADAVPTKPKWLDVLSEEYRRGGKPFMGHIVKQMGHMNGVAIYPNDVCRYSRQAFMCVQNAWDVVLREETIERTHSANHLIQHCWVLINGEPNHNGDGIVATFRDVGNMRKILDPNAVLFHRCKDGSLIDCLMQAKSSGLADKSTREPPYVPVQVTEPDPLITQTKYDKREFPTGFPKVEIFIVTYHKDAEFLKYSLASIKKFARGFTGVTVVCPDRDVEIIEPICREWGPSDTTVEVFTEVEGKGMIHHMAIECMADQFCSSDFILHTDSDCIFTEPVTPSDYFIEGQPVLLMEAYERFRDKHPGVLRWQEATQKALGRPIEFEFMRRHPAVHHRDLYAKTREMVEAHQHMPFLDWAVSGRNEFPQDWSEYNLLGAVAWIRKRQSYAWINTGKKLPPRDKICQMWSHGGLDRPSDTGAFVPMTPREIFQKVLGI